MPLAVAGFDQMGPKRDPRWQAALDRIAPRTNRGHDWLLLRWEPGDPWGRVERWVIYAMTPLHRVPQLGVREALLGPNPRRYGYYDGVERRFVQRVDVGINLQQWLIFREHGYFARPLWVVQGKRGGHFRRWTDLQQLASLLRQGPEFPPEMGALPYARFDQRALNRLRALDLVHRFGSILKLVASNQDVAYALDFREQMAAREMAEQLWDWMGDQVEEALQPGQDDGLSQKMVGEIWDHADPDAPMPDMDLGKEQFIETVMHSYAGV